MRALDPISAARAAAQTDTLTRQVAAIDAGAQLVSSDGIGAELWRKISPGRAPKGLHPFKAIQSGGRTVPATGGDLLFHIVSGRHDLNFELAMRVRHAIGASAEVIDEVHGFRYLDSRDLTGFIDGTQNPKGADRAGVALVGVDDPEFAGGSYVFTQRYVHDLARWSALEVREQERALGRAKPDSEELAPDVKPLTAHISRVVMEENGKELEIVRHSFPYGTVSEAGLFFIAYCAQLEVPERMLARMFGAAGDGLSDRLMDFTRPVTGVNFFAPSLEMLKTLGG
jgi:putative iron-dependent peroxidase